MDVSENRISICCVRENSAFPLGFDSQKIATFLCQQMEPYHDTFEDTLRGVRDSLAGKGFNVLALRDGNLVGAGVVVPTGMKGYVPENLLLFLAVDSKQRKQGIGKLMIQQIIKECRGNIKLHVEGNNPARFLYERMGFMSKYVEMRFVNE